MNKNKPCLVMLLITVICTMCSCASLVNNGEIPTYSEVLVVEGVDKNTLFKRANSWMVDTFKSAEAVIQYTDKEEGILKGKYTVSYPSFPYSYEVLSTITIEVKDEKVRFTSDYNTVYCIYKTTKNEWDSIPKDILKRHDADTKLLSESLLSALKDSTDLNW